MVTLQGLKRTAGHPLAREMHFQVVLFGLNILRYCTGLDQASQWTLKDTILSAALSWFCHQPRYFRELRADDISLTPLGGPLEAIVCKSKLKRDCWLMLKLHCGLWQLSARRPREFSRPLRTGRICSCYCSRTSTCDW